MIKFRSFLLSLLLFQFVSFFGQDNLPKYWAYRDRFNKDFVKIGSLSGESMLMSARSIGFAYSGADTEPDGFKPSRIYFQDATIYLGHYIALLASEFRLLSLNGEDVQPTLNELRYALLALNRLDLDAEEYLSQGINSQTPDDVNGLLLRDDVGSDFYDNFQYDYSQIFDRPCDFTMTHSDFTPVVQYTGDGYTAGQQLVFEPENVMSLDQITTIMTGLRCVFDFLPDAPVPITGQTDFNLHDEAQNIALRILHYIMAVEDGCNDSAHPCLIFKILNWDGDFVPRGGDLTFAAPQLIALAQHFEDPVINSYSWMQLGLMKVPLMVPAEKLDGLRDDLLALSFPIALDPVGTLCINNLIDELSDHIADNEPLIIGTIPLSSIRTILEEFEDQEVDISKGGDPCVHLSLDLIQAINAIEIGVEDMALCDDIVAAEAGAVLGEALAIISAQVGVNAPLMSFSISTYLALNPTVVIQSIILPLDILDGTVCIQDYMPEFEMNDDNIHILLELGTISGVWDEAYVKQIADASDMKHYNLLHAIFNNNGVPYNTTDEGLKAELIDIVPCHGIFADPLMDQYHPTTSTHSSYAMTNRFYGANRLFKPGDSNVGIPDASFRGEFSGIDFMVYHNLHRLLWPVAGFKRAASCECVVEITTEEVLTSDLTCTRKFTDYKAKGIPIESYLAHSLVVDDGVSLHVKNDLIICNQVESIPTLLTLGTGSVLQLYGGNAITVRTGNKIVLSGGAMLRAGLEDIDEPERMSTIILEDNAELIVEDASSILCYGGLRLVMKTGSKFILNGSQCIPASAALNGIWFDAEEATFEITDAALISSGCPDTDNVLRNCEFTADNSYVSLDATSSIDCNNFHASATEFTFTDATLSLSTRLDAVECNFHLTATDLRLEGGDLQVNAGSKFYWHGTDACVLNGWGARLLFDQGELHIPAGHIFTFSHDAPEGGYLEVAPDTENMLHTGSGSVFLIQGDDNEHVVLRIKDYAHLQNANFMAGDFKLQNCKVELNNHGNIFTDMDFTAFNVHFEDPDIEYEEITGAGVHVWYTDPVISNCSFNNVRFNAHFGKSMVNNTNFDGEGSGFECYAGNYKFNYCDFNQCGVRSESLALASSIDNSTFNQAEEIVRDESLVEVLVKHSDLDNGGRGIAKVGGKLTLRCCNFSGNETAIYMATGKLNLSSGDLAGYNSFRNNDYCIEIERQEEIDLYRGYNDFSGFNYFCIHGTLNQPCNASFCEMPNIDAFNNYWGEETSEGPGPVMVGGALYSPNPSMFDVHADHIPNHCKYEVVIESICNVMFTDAEPVAASPRSVLPCGSQDRVIVKSLQAVNLDAGKQVSHAGMLKDLEVDITNPQINTASFDHISLDSALVFAAMQMENYDSLANDAVAIDLFHQALTDSLDLSNPDIRRKMNWGRYHMKSAMEKMFVDGELSVAANQSAFEAPVQQYVDVLNLMTDTVLTDTTYHNQFFLELDKGQLFRTIDKPFIAQQVYAHLGDCQLDSLEQSIVNGWLQQVDIEISLEAQYMDDDVPVDSITTEVDTTGYTNPISYEVSNYYFGLWIDSPNSVTFVSCGDDPVYRMATVETAKLQLFPNPAHGFINVSSPDKEALYQVTLLDLGGRIISQSSIRLQGERNVSQFALPPGMAMGNYILRFSNDLLTEDHLVLID